MIKLAKINSTELEDGRTIHFRDITLSTAGLLQKVAGDNTDFQAMGEFLHSVLCDEDGKELKELKKIAPEDFYKFITAGEGTTLFTSIVKHMEDEQGN